MKNTAEEILRRIEVVKERKRIHRLSAVTGMLMFALVAVICGLSGTSGVKAGYSTLGSFLLGPQTGGYILVAVLAFAAGILVAVLSQKYRSRKSDRDGT